MSANDSSLVLQPSEKSTESAPDPVPGSSPLGSLPTGGADRECTLCGSLMLHMERGGYECISKSCGRKEDVRASEL